MFLFYIYIYVYILKKDQTQSVILLMWPKELGRFPVVDLVVRNSNHKAVSLLAVNMPRPQAAIYFSHYVYYFWANKFRVQTSDEFCISWSSKGTYSHVLSDGTR